MELGNPQDVFEAQIEFIYKIKLTTWSPEYGMFFILCGTGIQIQRDVEFKNSVVDIPDVNGK